MSLTVVTNLVGVNRFAKHYDSQAFMNSDAITLGPAHLIAFQATNKATAATLYLQFFDTLGPLTNGAVPIFAPIPLVNVSYIPPTSQIASVGSERMLGIYEFTKGMCWAASTSAGTLTLDATASVWVSAILFN